MGDIEKKIVSKNEKKREGASKQRKVEKFNARSYKNYWWQRKERQIKILDYPTPVWLTTCINANGKWNNLKFYLKFGTFCTQWRCARAIPFVNIVVQNVQRRLLQSSKNAQQQQHHHHHHQQQICTCFQLYFCWINLNFNIAHAKCIIIRLMQTQIAEHCVTLTIFFAVPSVSCRMQHRYRNDERRIGACSRKHWIKAWHFSIFRKKGRENVPDCTSSFPTTTTAKRPNATSWHSCVDHVHGFTSLWFAVGHSATGSQLMLHLHIMVSQRNMREIFGVVAIAGVFFFASSFLL